MLLLFTCHSTPCSPHSCPMWGDGMSGWQYKEWQSPRKEVGQQKTGLSHLFLALILKYFHLSHDLFLTWIKLFWWLKLTKPKGTRTLVCAHAHYSVKRENDMLTLHNWSLWGLNDIKQHATSKKCFCYWYTLTWCHISSERQKHAVSIVIRLNSLHIHHNACLLVCMWYVNL